MLLHSALKQASTLLFLLLTTTKTTSAASSSNGEEARWLVNTTLWGTLQWVEPSHENPDVIMPQSMVASYGELDGRIFYYLPVDFEFQGSLTLSEAQVDPELFDGARCGVDGDLDPEDPRCGKLTLSGTISPCPEDTKPDALAALFSRHPQMESWPPDHGFTVHEMQIDQLWMIANFGGGGFLTAEEYTDSLPVHHPVTGFPGFDRTRRLHQTEDHHIHPRPDFTNDAAGHARWLVAKSLWTTISTIDSRTDGQAFGNIRSVVDGGCFLDSKGTPYFYLPSPDPTAKDVASDDSIVLSFTEAALPQRVEDGAPCGGMDAMDPTCAKVTLMGRARVLEEAEVERARAGFGMQHPRADWLSKGGAHTGGDYFTIEIEGIEFLRTYGGPEGLTVEEYVGWVPSGEYDGEEECSTSDWVEDAGGWDAHSGGGYDHHDHHDHHEHDGMGDGMGEGQWGEGHHEHGMGEGHDHHEHGMGEGREHHDHHEEYASADYTEEDEKSTPSINSFLAGTAFGFLLWGPTIALIVYHKSCGRGRHGDTSVEYKPAVMA